MNSSIEKKINDIIEWTLIKSVENWDWEPDVDPIMIDQFIFKRTIDDLRKMNASKDSIIPSELLQDEKYHNLLLEAITIVAKESPVTCLASSSKWVRTCKKNLIERYSNYQEGKNYVE